jgi:hypothetical protein
MQLIFYTLKFADSKMIFNHLIRVWQVVYEQYFD